jgi:hypothetical protein
MVSQRSRCKLVVGGLLIVVAAIPVTVAILRNDRLSAAEANLVGTWLCLSGMPPTSSTAELHADRTVHWHLNREPRNQVYEILEFRGRWRAREFSLELSFPAPDPSMMERVRHLFRTGRWLNPTNIWKFSVDTDEDGNLKIESDDKAIVGLKVPDGIEAPLP